jgi:HD superfamily phosphohydrolase
MADYLHEIRDPIHVFIRHDDHERAVLNSPEFQRLRHVHQLALTYLVYPGATHKRFEHSLGVMELAARVFDVVTMPEHVTDDIRACLPEIAQPDVKAYWRHVLRMAALCHDIGHLPFSHAAEKQLLPQGWDHERFTREIISSPSMNAIWHDMTPPLRAEDVIKLAIGPKKATDLDFTDWETILSEIIVGDAFGVDRMDYLLRDSYHAGVAYGKFDHYRLIDTLRILPSPESDEADNSTEPVLGIEEGGIQSAEALMLARYFMYSQVYCHPVRRIYDIHLMDFLKEWLPQGSFSTDLREHLTLTDNQINAALLDADSSKEKSGHIHARRIIRREHFKLVYQRNPNDIKVNPEAGEAIYQRLSNEFGQENFRHDRYSQHSGSPDFPVRQRDGRIVSSLLLSNTLNHLPIVSVDYVFAERGVYPSAQKKIHDHLSEMIKPTKEGTQ